MRPCDLIRTTTGPSRPLRLLRLAAVPDEIGAVARAYRRTADTLIEEERRLDDHACELEMRYLREVLDSGRLGWYHQEGSMTTRLEEAFADKVGVKYGIARNSAMTALAQAVSVSGAGVGRVTASKRLQASRRRKASIAKGDRRGSTARRGRGCTAHASPSARETRWSILSRQCWPT